MNKFESEPKTEEEFREAVVQLLQQAREHGTDVAGEYVIEGDEVPEWRIRISEIDSQR